jgi:hypothetical protein
MGKRREIKFLEIIWTTWKKKLKKSRMRSKSFGKEPMNPMNQQKKWLQYAI